MPDALQKTLSLLLLILVGYLLKNKLIKEDQRKGLKTIILDLALPAMIFVALLKIKVDPELVLLPLLILGWNFIMLLITRFGLPLVGVDAKSPAMRTWMLLIPSLAPGLSCFPFLVEYLGEDSLAWGALADIGNKLYVLVFAYLLAMNWYYKVHQLGAKSSSAKIEELLITMVKEPINIVMVVALVLLGFGMSMETMPGFLSESILMLKDLMTPLVLLFIGVSVVMKWDQLQGIASILLLRAGLSLILSAGFIALVPLPNEAAVLLAVVFPLSACSFWPFAHMSAIQLLEKKKESSVQTFDLNLGINILAISLPLSTILILGIFSSGSFFTIPNHLFISGGVMVALPILPKIFKWARRIEIPAIELTTKNLNDSHAEGR
jgi:hypothetical protein